MILINNMWYKKHEKMWKFDYSVTEPQNSTLQVTRILRVKSLR